MEWPTILGLVIGNATWITPLFIWVRAESRNDIRHMETKIDAWKSESLMLITAIKDEIKDFHGRLCAIEERRK